MLSRPDATVADTVDYGGAGWPVPISGQSLELVNLAGDNNDPANWGLSTGAGTPGVPTGGGPVITVRERRPSAPPRRQRVGDRPVDRAWRRRRLSVTGYQVKVLNGAGAQVGALRPAAAGATSLAVTGLTNGTAYHFQVAATNSAGTGAFSASSNTVTPVAATVPGRPYRRPDPGAAGGALTAVAHWTAPSSTGGSPITGYQVTILRMSSSAANATVLSTTTSAVLGASVRQLSVTLASGNYRFQVVAINAVGTSQPSARSANVVPR